MAQNTDDAVRARREYQKRWRAANKDRVRRYNENFWRRKAKELSERDEEEVSSDAVADQG